MAKNTLHDLQMLQSLPLEVKVAKTKLRINEWIEKYGEDGVYISFSGGKDSTVLLHIARQMYPNLKAVFVNTGLEYPEIVQFVKTFDNVDWLRPKMNFKEVVEKYGFPFISKEVSECVDGARKYIKILTDRQTDSLGLQVQTTYRTRRISKGGYDSKYRKLRGIGEYSKKSKNTFEVQGGNGNACEKSKTNSDGEYP